MKKKHMRIALIMIGAVLIAVSIVLAMIAAGNKSIVGGADLPTFCFMFLHAENGLYAALSLLGCVAIFAAALAGIIKKKP